MTRRLKVALDCDVPERLASVFNSLYGHRGFEFFPVTEFAPGNSTDDHWADAFKRFGGHVTLSGDGQIAYKPHKALAFIDNGFISFFFATPWQRTLGHVKAAHAVYWWPIIERQILLGPRGRCWRIPCDLKMANNRLLDLRLVPGELESLVIPEEVLEQARHERAMKPARAASPRAPRQQTNKQGKLSV